MATALTINVLDTQSNQSFEITFERYPVRVGRNQLSDLHIERPYVSQFHAAIEVTDKKIWVKDLGSTNGTIYRGQRMAREQAVDVTGLPEIAIGPLRLSFQLEEQAATASAAMLSVLDIGTPAGSSVMETRLKAPAPGQEDPFIRQLVPYIEAYRAAWANVYRLVYEHLQRLQPEVRAVYLKRLIIEHNGVAQEDQFQKVAQYYGVPAQDHGELTSPMAALAAVSELAAALAPEIGALDDTTKVLGFSRRLRDAMEVFLKAFVSLRDGYNEFETEVLRKEHNAQQAGNKVVTAKDADELGKALFAHDANSGVTSRQLHDIFVEVMTHQVALLNGVMEGVKQLLQTLSPAAVEKSYERKGKKGGLFSNKYEGLWEAYQTVHGDYMGEDKETFLIIFGPQFSRAYAATTGEAFDASGDGAGKGAGSITSANPRR